MTPRGARIAFLTVLTAATAGLWPVLADLRKEVEPNDPATRAQPIVPAASAGGVISAPGDVDLYAVRVEAGQTLSADILARGFRAGSSSGSQLTAVLEILDTDGITVLAQDQSVGEFDDPTVAFQVTATGRYFVSVRDLSPTAGGPGSLYVLSVEVDSNDAFATATPVLPPVLPSIDALIYPPADIDNYSFHGVAGQVLTADIDSAVFNPDQPAAKMVLTVYDPSQTSIAQDAYTSTDPNDPYIQIRLQVSGVYTVRAREIRSYVGTTNTFYQLSLELGPYTANNAFTDGMPVTIPRAVSGVVSPAGDLDHFQFTLPAPRTLGADLDAQEGLVSLLDGTLRAWNAAGQVGSNASSPDPALSLSLASGDYSVSVEGPCVGGSCLNEDSYYVLFLDSDADGDGVRMPADSCPVLANAAQTDGDSDGVGDPCDNCAAVFNPDQRDSDGNGQGDACLCAVVSEVALDLSWTGTSTLTWSAAAGASTYNVYRGSRSAGWTYNHTCLLSALVTPGISDSGIPVTGTAFYYLVSGKNACGEGPLGTASGGQPRPNSNPCP